MRSHGRSRRQFAATQVRSGDLRSRRISLGSRMRRCNSTGLNAGPAACAFAQMLIAMRSSPARCSGNKRRRHLGHETGYLLLHLSVRFQANIEVEDHLIKSRRLDPLQRLSDKAAAAKQDGVLGEVLRAEITEPLHHTGEVAIAWWRGL